MRVPIAMTDFPWKYNDYRKMRADGVTPTKGIGACNHYNGMSTEELCNLRPWIDCVVADRCMLFMWIVPPLVPDALEVARAWGFEYCTIAFDWIKINRAQYAKLAKDVRAALQLCADGQITGIDLSRAVLHKLIRANPGYYTWSNCEQVWLFRRGRPYRFATGRKGRQAQLFDGELFELQETTQHVAPLGKHSEKPDLFYDIVAEMYPQCEPRLDMFGRKERPGWIVVGNEAPGFVGVDIRDALAEVSRW